MAMTVATASKWISAEQALKVLGVQAQTLYANVSRGRIRAKPDPGDSRRSLYSRSDVARLAERRGGRRSAAKVAAQAMGFGEAVLASGISTVADGRLWYRGRDAVALSQRATLEEVAGLLWQSDATVRLRDPAPVAALPTAEAALQRLLAAAAERAAVDPPTPGRSVGALRVEAEGLLAALRQAALTGKKPHAGHPTHARLAAAWRSPAAADILRRALVLLADHELNASTFAVRVAASTRASLAACLLAGLATLTGPLHGGAARALRSLCADARHIGATKAVREWLARGLPLPAFAHPLYPEGDPRAIALMGQLELSGLLADVRAAGEELTGELPNVDFALAALADVHRLPEHAPFVIFALSRSVGWIAHALEQIATGELIRPRARYNGPALNREPQ
jgi:citrate synthase